LSRVPGFDPNTIDGINTGFNMALSRFPLKIGCCMRDVNDKTPKTAKIRIPPTQNAIGELKDFGFNWDSNLNVGVCPANLYKGSIDCDTFYNIYCANVNKVFTEQFGKQIDDSNNKYVAYAPECACYAPLTIGQESYPSGIPSACYKAGCAVSDSPSYPDPVSRTQPCDVTICSTVFNASDIKAGSANINPTIVQECGKSAITKTEKTEINNEINNENINNETKSETNMIIFGIISCCCFLSIILIFYMFMKRGG
jgi:hypothetical protein